MTNPLTGSHGTSSADPDAGANQPRYPDTHLTMINTLRRRRAVPLDLFYDYWRDAHTQISCRLPGIHQLWEHHVSYEGGRVWPVAAGVRADLAEADQFEGIPEVLFARPEDVTRFVAGMGPLMDDEQNIFEETIGYRSIGHDTRTYVDTTADGAPNGDVGDSRFIIFLQASGSVDTTRLRAYLSDDLAPRLAASVLVRKLRLHLFERYDNAEVVLDARQVSHFKAANRQYQAAYQIDVANRLDLSRFINSPQWQASEVGQAAHIGAAHAFQIVRTYTPVFGGKLTLAGQRTAAVARQIERVGAVNQLSSDVARIVLHDKLT